MESTQDYMRAVGERARRASKTLASAPVARRNAALRAIAEAIAGSRDSLLAANLEDVERGSESGLDAALMDRLTLTEPGIDGFTGQPRASRHVTRSRGRYRRRPHHGFRYPGGDYASAPRGHWYDL